MPEVRKERTDWRDNHLDKIHKLFGYDCPCENVEFLMVEYDQATPVALVDYRLKERSNLSMSNTVKELSVLTTGEIPYIITEYSISNNSICDIDIKCCNKSAEEEIGNRNNLSEREYIEIMYSIRDKIVPGRRQQGVELANQLSPVFNTGVELWNGEIISHRHRDWGWDCPVVDIDFIVVNNGVPSALIEYKNKKSFATPSKFKFHPTGKTLKYISDNSHVGLPLLFVYYTDDFEQFRVYPISRFDRSMEPYFGVDLSKDEYFSFLKRL